LLKRTVNEVDAIRLEFVAAGFRTDVTPAQAGELSRIVARLAEIDTELTSGRGAEFLGAVWAGRATDPASIRTALRTSEALRSSAPEGTLAAFTEPASAIIETVGLARGLGAAVTECARKAQATLRRMLERVVEDRLIDIEVTRLAHRQIADLADMFGRAARARDDLMRWVTLRRGIADARADGLAAQ
jgi:hypothetical protein